MVAIRFQKFRWHR